MIKPIIKAVLLAVLLTCGARSAGQVTDKMERMLGLVATFEYDQSRTWQQDYQDLMKDVYNHPEIRGEIEKMMVDFLRSDATKAGKQLICKELGIIGSDYSVAVLSEMLSEPELAGTALLALEKIPGEIAGQALRDKLASSPKDVNISIINAIAVRKDEKAILQLGDLIHDRDTEIAIAAIAALGSIESALGAGILEEFFKNAPEELKWETANSLIKCADHLLQQNETKLAARLYNQVYKANPPLTLKYAALEGKFLTSAEDQYTLISGYLQNEDPVLHRWVMRLIYKVPKPEGFGQLLSDIPSLPAESKLYLINVLSDVHYYSVRPDILTVINSEDPFTRITAIKALPGVGMASDARLLASIAAESRGKEQDAARESLYILAAENTNDSILAAIETTDGMIRAELIRSTGERNMTDAIPLLISSTSHANRNVRTESIRALGILSPPEYLPEMIEILYNSQSRRERVEAERAILSLIEKYPPGTERSVVIINALDSGADDASTISLISILGQIGDNKDLPILQKYLDSENDEIQIAAIKALSGWPDASPLEDLKEIVLSTDDQRKHTLSLRGWVEVVITDLKMTSKEKLAEVKEAWYQASNAGEKKIVVSGFSRIRTIPSLETALSLMDDPEIKKEAEAAVVSIAESTSWGYPEDTRKLLEIFLSKTDNEGLKSRASRILERIQ